MITSECCGGTMTFGTSILGARIQWGCQASNIAGMVSCRLNCQHACTASLRSVCKQTATATGQHSSVWDLQPSPHV